MVDNSLRDIEGKMGKSIEALKKELASIRTGHASPALIAVLQPDFQQRIANFQQRIAKMSIFFNSE